MGLLLLGRLGESVWYGGEAWGGESRRLLYLDLVPTTRISRRRESSSYSLCHS